MKLANFKFGVITYLLLLLSATTQTHAIVSNLNIFLPGTNAVLGKDLDDAFDKKTWAEANDPMNLVSMPLANAWGMSTGTFLLAEEVRGSSLAAKVGRGALYFTGAVVCIPGAAAGLGLGLIKVGAVFVGSSAKFGYLAARKRWKNRS